MYIYMCIVYIYIYIFIDALYSNSNEVQWNPAHFQIPMRRTVDIYVKENETPFLSFSLFRITYICIYRFRTAFLSDWRNIGSSEIPFQRNSLPLLYVYTTEQHGKTRIVQQSSWKKKKKKSLQFYKRLNHLKIPLLQLEKIYSCL